MENLPLHIRKLAREIFAGQTGFSGPEIHEFFKEYSSDIPDYSGGASRWMIFENFLASFSLEKQTRILLRLCDYDVPMKHGQPNNDDRQKLQKWLLETHVMFRKLQNARSCRGSRFRFLMPKRQIPSVKWLCQPRKSGIDLFGAV